MLNKTEAVNSKKVSSREEVVVAFQKFNDVFLCKVADGKGKETYAFGEKKHLAQQNALRNYRRKYSLVFS